MRSSAAGSAGAVRLRVDGGLKTGRDVVLAALLGADEFSFGTALLLAEGCIMVRTCHLDTCPVGIATQRPELRARFAGTPEMVVSYLTSVADDVRRTLADLGLRSLEDAIGRVDLLRAGRRGGSRTVSTCPNSSSPRASDAGSGRRARSPRRARTWGTGSTGTDGPRCRPAPTPPCATRSRPRTARSARASAGRSGGGSARTDPPGSVRASFDGSAGQSFGAFLASGVDLRLVGEANDHVGKGMSGGRIVISPPADDVGDAHLAGNAVLYGATGGRALRGWSRRRTVRGAELRRGGRGRGHGRARLRVHDRRARRGARVRSG